MAVATADDALTVTKRVNSSTISTWCGMGAIALGLILPWISVSLQRGLSPVDIRVRAPGIGMPSWLTYGAILIAALTTATVALVMSRGRPTAITSVAGVVAILTPLSFWAGAALGDLRMIDLLTRRATELKMITGQFGYRIPSARLTG